MKLGTAIGQVIRDIRLERGMTMRQLSNKSHVSLGHISQLEIGTKEGSSAIWQALAEGLGVPLHQIVIEAGYKLQLNNSDTYTDLTVNLETVN